MFSPSLSRGLMVALFTLLVDQISKNWVVMEYGFQSRLITEVTGFFNLVLVWNRGVSFGMFSQHPEYIPWVLTGVALVITAILIRWLTQTERMIGIVALGMVIGGAIGNVIDRIRFGAVIDFLDFHVNGYHWPAFNIADAAIFCGVMLLLLETLTQPDKDTLQQKADA